LNQKFELLQKSGFLVQIAKRNNEMRQDFFESLPAAGGFAAFNKTTIMQCVAKYAALFLFEKSKKRLRRFRAFC
jgi:hypothetical protein